ncbi:MAG: cytochrome c oxidase accessory protein CcoG [Myxococcales bacterium]|nr:cytochrome c oxidase accessory protein CcoG [Myxococcales bacterium]
MSTLSSPPSPVPAEADVKPTRHLNVIPATDEIVSSLSSDGHRRFVYPADVKGRFTWLRRVGFAVLIALWIALPLIPINGHPALFLDVVHRRFYIFGQTFNAQDVWLMFFVLTGIGFGLAFLTSLLGRVWCGYACPQTVFLESLFRPIERLVEGNRDQRIRRDKGPWNLDKTWRKLVKHALFLAAAFAVSHIMLSFFVSMPAMLQMVRRSPSEHPEAFAWATAVTLILYGNFAWFREQLCLIVCPYGRLQSVLFDEDSLIIGYDKKRGEPRGKASEKDKGDCVDCKRCIAVCPTGIDIRNGLQLDCVACAACVDACDEIMDKLKRPRGLVRYDSQRGLSGETRRLWRPRMGIYAVLGAAGITAASIAVTSRSGFEATMLREKGAPYVVEGETVRNSFTLHLVNKEGASENLRIEPEPSEGLSYVVSEPEVTIESLADTRVRIVVVGEKGKYGGDKPFQIQVTRSDGEKKTVKSRFVGPGG